MVISFGNKKTENSWCGIRINNQWRIIFMQKMLRLLIIINKNIMQQLPDIHPSEILLEEFMKLLGINAYRLANDLEIPQFPNEEKLVFNKTKLPITLHPQGK